jgi:penicillin-binding protein 1A
MTTQPSIRAAAPDLDPQPRDLITTVGWQGLALLVVGIISIPLYLALTFGMRRFNRLDEPTRRRAIRAFGLSAVCGTVGLGLAVYVMLYGGEFPRLDALTADQVPTIGRIDDARGQALAEVAVEYRRPISELDIPPVLSAALLSAEDKRFFDHDGVDYTAVPRIVGKAASASWRAGRLALPQGGSTITMQLARIVFLPDWTAAENGPRTIRDTWIDRLAGAVIGVPATNKLRRKLEEVRLALWIEREFARQLGSKKLAKAEILRRYAASIYLGDGRYGFAAAAEHYLGRPLSTFDTKDMAEAALLAGIPKWPARYSPSEENRTRSLRRRNHVLGLMAERGYLSEDERVRYASQPVPVPSAPDAIAVSGPSSVVHGLLDAMKDAGDPRVYPMALFEGRIRVRSTVDARMQKLLVKALEDGLQAYEARHPGSRGIVQGSAVVLGNADARILAMAGGRQVFKNQPARSSDLNRATESRRQPGSAMKPLAYLAAFRRGAGLDTEILDAPIAVPMGSGRPPKWINNYDGKFRGPIPLRLALAESRNAATIRLVTTVGIGDVVRTAHDMGIRSPLQPYVTTGLGASEVTLLELANAYRAMASGVKATPWILDRVATSDGLDLFHHSDPTLRLIDDPALALVQEALRGAIRLPGGTGHALASLSVPVMGKTGTTTGFRDALFVGSTFGESGITVAVRIGFDDNRSLGEGETGGRCALPVFRKLVELAYQRGVLGPVPTFPPTVEQGIDAYMIASAPPPEPVLAAATPVAAVAAAPTPVAAVAAGPGEATLLTATFARAGTAEAKASEAVATR